MADSRGRRRTEGGRAVEGRDRRSYEVDRWTRPHLSGAGHPGLLRLFGAPFAPSLEERSEALSGWIVSDFGLNDAIESGLVKTPRAWSETTGGLMRRSSVPACTTCTATTR